MIPKPLVTQKPEEESTEEILNYLHISLFQFLLNIKNY